MIETHRIAIVIVLTLIVGIFIGVMVTQLFLIPDAATRATSCMLNNTDIHGLTYLVRNFS